MTKDLHINIGNILLVHSNNEIGGVIQFGMRLRRLLRLKPKRKVYNHAGIGLTGNMLSEAVAKGIVSHDLAEAYKGRDVELTVYEYPFTADQLVELEEIAEQYKGTKYQFANFLQFVPEIILNIWIGKKNKEAQKRLYCTEWTALAINIITDGKYFKKYWRASPNIIHEWCEKHCKKVNEWK